MTRFSMYDWQRRLDLFNTGKIESSPLEGSDEDVEAQRERTLSLTDPLDYTSLKPSIVAAHLLFARNILRRLDAEQLPSTNSAIIALAVAGKSQAYAMLSCLEAANSTLERPPGPPPSSTPPDTVNAILVAVRDFLMEHPGAVAERGSRNRYSETFRRFVLGLLAPNGLAADLTVEQTAEAVGVPLGSLKGWYTLILAPTWR